MRISKKYICACWCYLLCLCSLQAQENAINPSDFSKAGLYQDYYGIVKSEPSTEAPQEVLTELLKDTIGIHLINVPQGEIILNTANADYQEALSYLRKIGSRHVYFQLGRYYISISSNNMAKDINEKLANKAMTVMDYKDMEKLNYSSDNYAVPVPSIAHTWDKNREPYLLIQIAEKMKVSSKGIIIVRPHNQDHTPPKELEFARSLSVEIIVPQDSVKLFGKAKEEVLQRLMQLGKDYYRSNQREQGFLAIAKYLYSLEQGIPLRVSTNTQQTTTVANQQIVALEQKTKLCDLDPELYKGIWDGIKDETLQTLNTLTPQGLIDLNNGLALLIWNGSPLNWSDEAQAFRSQVYSHVTQQAKTLISPNTCYEAGMLDGKLMVNALGAKALAKIGSGAVRLSKTVLTAEQMAKLEKIEDLVKATKLTTIEEFWARIPIERVKETQDAFVKGTARLKYTTEDIILYRHCSDNAPDLSNWYTDKILSIEDAKTLLALPKNNTAQKVVTVKIPKGTPYIEGKVASQNSFGNIQQGKFDATAIGGGTQYYFLQEHIAQLKAIGKPIYRQSKKLMYDIVPIYNHY